MSLYKFTGLSEQSSDFRARLETVASNLGIDPNWLAAVIAFESAHTWAPDVVVGGGRYRGSQDNSKAVGLIQFTNVAINAMAKRGWTTTKAQLAAMTNVEQLTWVERYFVMVVGSKTLSNISDVYMAVLAPVGIGQADSYALYSSPSAAYSANRGLDTNGDGVITRSEACSGVKTLYSQAQSRGVIVEPATTILPTGGLTGDQSLRWFLAGDCRSEDIDAAAVGDMAERMIAHLKARCRVDGWLSVSPTRSLHVEFAASEFRLVLREKGIIKFRAGSYEALAKTVR